MRVVNNVCMEAMLCLLIITTCLEKSGRVVCDSISNYVIVQKLKLDQYIRSMNKRMIPVFLV
jgi:hypothetical protein